MPQPFLKVAPAGSNVVLDSIEESIFSKCPDLSLLALAAIASWSSVDVALLRVFIQLMGGAETMSASIYVALESQAAKTAAIQAAARSALSDRPEEAILLRAVLKIAKTQQKFRDKLAHWVWGYCPNLPNSLLLMDPKRNYGGLHKKDTLVYLATDFRQYLEENKRLEKYCWQLAFVIEVREPTPKRQNILASLSEAPEVAGILRQLVSHGDEA